MDLSPEGHTQAERLADYLRETCFDAIYASPMKRARQTLEPLLKIQNCPPTFLPDLREIHFGDWTGLSWQELHDQHRVSAFQWLDMLEAGAIPNAECVKMVRTRVGQCLDEIIASQAGKKVAVLCHGGIIRMILSILLAAPLPLMAALEIEYASVTEVECDGERNRVHLLNFTPWRDL